MACIFGATSDSDDAEEQFMECFKETAYLSMAKVYFYEGNNVEARRYLNMLKEMNAQNTVSITRDMNEAERILKEIRQLQAQVFQTVSLKYEYFPLHRCTKVDWEFVMKYVDFKPIKYLALAEEDFAKRNFDEARQNLTRAKDLNFWGENDENFVEPVKYTKNQIVEDAIKAVKFTECYYSSLEEIEDAIKMYLKAATAAGVLTYRTIKDRFAIKAALLRNELAILKAKRLQEENHFDEQKGKQTEIEKTVNKKMEHEGHATGKKTASHTIARQTVSETTQAGVTKYVPGKIPSIEELVAEAKKGDKRQAEKELAYFTLTEVFFCDDNICEAKRFLSIPQAAFWGRSYSSQIQTIEKQIKVSAEIRRDLVLCQEQIFNRIAKKHKHFPIHFCIKVDWETVLKYVYFEQAKILATALENYAKRDYRLAEKILKQARSIPLGYEYRSDEGSSVPVMENEGLSVPVKGNEGPVKLNDETSVPFEENKGPVNDIEEPLVHVKNNKETSVPVKDNEVSYLTVKNKTKANIKIHIITDITNIAKTEEIDYSNLTENLSVYVKAAEYAGMIGEKELRDRFWENFNVIDCVSQQLGYCSIRDIQEEGRRRKEKELRDKQEEERRRKEKEMKALEQPEHERKPPRTGFCSIQ